MALSTQQVASIMGMKEREIGCYIDDGAGGTWVQTVDDRWTLIDADGTTQPVDEPLRVTEPEPAPRQAPVPGKAPAARRGGRR